MKARNLFLLTLVMTLAAAATPIERCGIYEGGTFALAADILATASPCIILGENASLEGNGHTLMASREYNGIGISVAGSNAHLTGLILTNFEVGIVVKGNNTTITHTEVLGPAEGGEVGILIEGASGVTLYNITVLNYKVAIASEGDVNTTKAILSDYESLGRSPPPAPLSLYNPGGGDEEEPLSEFRISYRIEGGRLIVEVKDDNGRPVDNALVLLRKYYAEGRYTIVATATTEDGVAVVELPSEGRYSFKVKKRGFKPYESEPFFYTPPVEAAEAERSILKEGMEGLVPAAYVVPPTSSGGEDEGSPEGSTSYMTAMAVEEEHVERGILAGAEMEGMEQKGTGKQGVGEGKSGGNGEGSLGEVSEEGMDKEQPQSLPYAISGGRERECNLLCLLLLFTAIAVVVGAAVSLKRLQESPQNPFKALQRKRRRG